MEKIDRIKNILKTNNLDELNKYNVNTLANISMELLEKEMNDFDYEKDIDYLDTLIKLLPLYLKKNPRIGKADEKLKVIHQQVKKYLVQKPGNIEKTNHNYKLLKNLINNIELIQMSILYDYNDKYEGSKYKLIDYIIFDLKNISIFKDALQKFPYLVNYFDESNKKIIVSVIDKYIEEVMNYNKEKGIDDIIYYDEVINLILKSPIFIFDIIDKQTILKKIKQKLTEIKKEKYRKTFYLNNLVERINEEEEILDNSYLEYKYNIPTVFNAAINSEVRKIVNNYSISKDRAIIDDYILTFDGEDTKEIDDALSVKITNNDHILLGVHIADPTSLIDKDSIIFEEAAKRTTSIYLSDKTYSMFPSQLSSNLVSLNEGNYRPATSYYFEFNKEGKLIKSNFIKSVIKVDKNMTYNDFTKILYMNGNDKTKETIFNLNKVSNILQNYYKKDPLYEKINRSEKNITNTNIIGISNGEKVVESTMIFTNYMVAKYFKDNHLPFIYRNHTINEEMMNNLDKLKYNIIKEDNNEAYLRYIEMVKNIYPKALYEVESKGHYGLGIDTYCHITSPLRRMADVIGLICLDKFYFSEYEKADIKKTKTLILKHSKRINDKRNSIEKFTVNYENLTR